MSSPTVKEISVCHIAVADLWAGAEVQLKVLLSRLPASWSANLRIQTYSWSIPTSIRTQFWQHRLPSYAVSHMSCERFMGYQNHFKACRVSRYGSMRRSNESYLAIASMQRLGCHHKSRPRTRLAEMPVG